jgi:predicted GTPase
VCADPNRTPSATSARARRVVIMGAGGRDFHTFNTLYRDDPRHHVVAFTAAQIPGIDDRVYPPALAGRLYPDGIRIVPESRLLEVLRVEEVEEVVLAYSDLSHDEVMHKASVVLAEGAAFSLPSPAETMLWSSKPVIAVCAVRTGCGKSPTTRRVGGILHDRGLRVALVRHPMPYGDLERARVQRFATLADIDAVHPTVEEREEYEAPVRAGMVMFSGVDYADVLRAAVAEADVIVWDGGNNDLPFFAPHLQITLVDPLRPGHELRYHPGEANLRRADVVVVNKVDSARPADVDAVIATVGRVNPRAAIVRADSPVTLEPGPPLHHARALVVDDGPTLTHGGMPFGAGTVAARRAGVAALVDPRPYAVGSLRETFAAYPGIGPVLPAMGYGNAQLDDLAATIRATPCDVVITGTPVDLGRIIDVGHPLRRATYELREVGALTLERVLAPYLERWSGTSPTPPAGPDTG